MRVVDYLVLRLVLYVFFAFLTSPIPVCCSWMVEYLDAHEQVRILKWIFVLGFVLWLFGVPWLTSKAAGHMAFEN